MYPLTFWRLIKVFLWRSILLKFFWVTFTWSSCLICSISKAVFASFLFFSWYLSPILFGTDTSIRYAVLNFRTRSRISDDYSSPVYRWQKPDRSTTGKNCFQLLTGDGTCNKGQTCWASHICCIFASSQYIFEGCCT